MLKKTAIAVMALTASGMASAAMYAPAPAPTCTPGNVTIPCEASKWDIGVQALYLQATHDADATYFNTVNGYQDFKQDWGWGFKLDGSYHFGTGNDVTASWLHFDKTTDHSFDLGLQNGGVHNYSLNSRLEQFNMVMGQHVDAGMNKNIRFYGGLQYAQIRSERDARFNTLAPGSTSVFTDYHVNVARKFSGVGPSIGTDFSYDLGNGFSFTANAASALLYGTSKNYMTTTIAAAPGVVIASSAASNKMIVPEVEAKLGAAYSHNMAQGVLTIEGGYQAMNYFNALVVMNNGLTNSDFGLQGPYLGVKWLGNA